MIDVPVGALMTDERTFVIDRWNVTYTPSSSVLAWIKEQPKATATTSLLALGDPPFNKDQAHAMDQPVDVVETALARGSEEWEAIYRGAALADPDAISNLDRLGGTRLEIEAIADLFASKDVLVGREASEENVLRRAIDDELSRHRYVHIATHAFPNNRHGVESALVLSQVDLPDAWAAATRGERIIDGRLTMIEVMREWRLDADLVTLSACETALGQRARGEGYVGFSHAFFQAGSKTLVVSLWKVSDRPTRLLMERFYENMVKKGMSKSEALREAKLWLRDKKDRRGRTPYSDPAFWSAFVLVGDPG
jgi:CHAT domain-containing protein